MDFVVTGYLLARRVINQTRIINTIGLVIIQRQCPAHQPNAVATGLIGQKILNRAIARRLFQGQLVGVFAAHETKILRKRDKLRTIVRRLSNERCRDRKSVVSGKSVLVRVDLGGRRIIKKKNKEKNRTQYTKITRKQDIKINAITL